ncbi:G-D-S-L family lipolytic protein [Nonlabens spongiae]|nr:G-D-S-L family lipolytic protein [Nonlabens spongiae]
MMKRSYIKILGLLFVGTALVSCENEFDESVEDGDFYTAGEADFSNYVTVGNSLTAGFADGALYLQGQQNSYPNIIAGQLEHVGGGEFFQPLVNDNLGGLLAGGNQITDNRFVLAVDADGNPGPAIQSGTPTTDITNKVTGPLNNFGVPGAKSYHLAAPGYGSVAGVAMGTANPYYARFSSSETSTVIQDAAAANPTFFTLWIGNNDILGYATSGGTKVDPSTGEVVAAEDHNVTGNVDPSTYAGNDITNNMVFAGVYSQLVTALTANGAKGALVNIPDVTSIPFFTTVPPLALSPADPTFGPQIPLLNQVYGGLNQVFAAFGQADRSIQFSSTGASGIVIRDESLADLSQNPAFATALTPVVQGIGAAVGLPLSPAQAAGLAQVLAPQFGQIRQATADDLVTLRAASVIGTLDQDRFNQLNTVFTQGGIPAQTAATLAGQFSVNGVTVGMANQFVLTTDEQDNVADAQASYNATISQLAAANGLALVDARAELQTVAQGGVPFNGGLLTSEFVTGGAFSLDGVHPTPRGYAYTANAIIEAINAQYGSTIPMVNIGQYGTIQTSNIID